jgi:hypothetical protein
MKNMQDAGIDNVFGELTTTKIITLWEVFNFVSEVSCLLYEWSSDCWCIWKSFGVNACLHWRNVFSFHWRSVFAQFFDFFEFIFDCTCALAHQSQCAGIVYEHYCLCSRPTPAGPVRRRYWPPFVIIRTAVGGPWVYLCPRLGLVWAPQGIAIIS